MIDYILTSPEIENAITSIIIDEEGAHRIKSKKESDHNTILMTIKINTPRMPQYTERWKLNNKEGWKEFNKKMEDEIINKNVENMSYEEAENTIRRLMTTTIGKTKIRTDKTPKSNTPAIKIARETKKETKKRFQEACQKGNHQEITSAKNEYITAQKKT